MSYLLATIGLVALSDVDVLDDETRGECGGLGSGGLGRRSSRGSSLDRSGSSLGRSGSRRSSLDSLNLGRSSSSLSGGSGSSGSLGGDGVQDVGGETSFFAFLCLFC